MVAEMKTPDHVPEAELAALAKKYRTATGKTRSAASRDMGTKPPAIHYAEESPKRSFTKLRCRMIEAYSNLKVSGPYYRLEER